MNNMFHMNLSQRKTHMSNDIIKARTKPTTSNNSCLHILRSEVNLFPWSSTMNPKWLILVKHPKSQELLFWIMLILLPLLDPSAARINTHCSSRIWWWVVYNLIKNQSNINVALDHNCAHLEKNKSTLRSTLSLLLMYDGDLQEKTKKKE